MNKERLWTKDYIAVLMINFLITLVLFLLMITIASYAVNEFHVTTALAGLVSGIFIIGAFVGRLITGRMIEDVGSKKSLIIGLILSIITSALYLGANNIPLLLINRILHGIAYGGASTAAGTIVAQIIPPGRHGEGVGYYGLGAILATAVGPFIGIFLTQYADFKMIFVFSLLLGIISLAVTFMISQSAHKSLKQDQIIAEKSFKISNYFEFNTIPIAIVSSIIGFTFSGIMSFLSFYSKQIQLEEAASFFFLAYAITILTTRPFFGRLFDRKGANAVVYPCLLLFAIGMALFSQAQSGINLLLAAIIIGLSFGNYISAGQAIAIKSVPANRLGLATSTYYMLYDIGCGIGPFLLGSLVPFTGYRGLYLMMAIVILADIVLYHFLHGRKEKQLNHEKIESI
jgi:Arabinose efflux permease